MTCVCIFAFIGGVLLVFSQLSIQWRQQSGEAVHEYQMPCLVWPNPNVFLCQRSGLKGEHGPSLSLPQGFVGFFVCFFCQICSYFDLKFTVPQLTQLQIYKVFINTLLIISTTPSSLIHIALPSSAASQMEGWSVCKYSFGAFIWSTKPWIHQTIYRSLHL